MAPSPVPTPPSEGQTPSSTPTVPIPSADEHRTQGQLPNPTPDQPKPLCVFLSHSKKHASAKAQMLHFSMEKINVDTFLDCNDMKNIKDLVSHVEESTHFFLVMSEYDVKTAIGDKEKEKFGPFTRPSCVVEIITWFAKESRTDAVVIEIQQEGMKPSVIPTTLTELEAMFEVGGWEKVIRDTGKPDAKELAFKACQELQRLKEKQSLKWAPTNLDASPGQIAKILALVKEDHQLAPKAKEHTNAQQILIVCSKDAEDEAALIAQETKVKFGESVFISINENFDFDNVDKASSVVCLLTTGLLGDKEAWDKISLAKDCVQAAALVTRPRTDEFDFDNKAHVPSVGGDEVKEKFKNLTKICAKMLSAHSSTRIVKSQLKDIWELLDLVPPKSLYPLLPYLNNVHGEAEERACEFVEGTGKWFFGKVNELIVDGQKKAVALVGTAALGKSVLLGELCARYSVDLAGKLGTGRLHDDAYFVGALHFFKHNDASLNSARIAIGSIARQLDRNVDGFRAALKESLKDSTEGQLMNLEELFKISILKPAQATELLSDGNRQVLVVLDALDECAEWDVLFALLRKLWPQMPSWFALVVSMRSVEGFALGTFDLLPFEAQQNIDNGDIKLFVKFKLGQGVSEEVLEEVSKIVNAKANGLFLYAVLACKELEEFKKSELYTPALLEQKAGDLPNGLDEYYVEFFSGFKSSMLGSTRFYTAGLAPILAARVPLPEVVWRQTVLLAFEAQQSLLLYGAVVTEDKLDDKIKEALLRLLDFSGGTVKVLHKSMYDFLRWSDEAKRHSLMVDISIGHELIAQRAVSFEFSGPTWEQLNGEAELYFAGHGLFHMMELFDAATEQFLDNILEQMLGEELEDLLDTTTKQMLDAVTTQILNLSTEQMLGKVIKQMSDTAIKQVLDLDKLMRLIWAAKQNSSFFRLVRDVQALLLVADDPKIKFALSLLHLSEKAVMKDPREFSGQVLGRVMIAPFSKVQLFWIQQAQEWIERASGEGQLEVMVPMCFGRSGLQPAGTSLVKVLRGHTHVVSSVTISPDSRFIVTGSEDKTARVWDFQTGEGKRVLKGHTSRVTSAAISPDSGFILTGSGDNTVRVWDFATGKEMMVFKGHTELVTSVAISPNSRFIVTGSEDNKARVWNFLTGKEIRVLDGHSGWVTSVAISPDSKFIATGFVDCQAQVWNLVTSEEWVLKGHTDQVTSVAFFPDSRCIATGSMDGTVRVWDFQAGTETMMLKGHTCQVTSVAISPDSKFIVTGSKDKTTRVWDFASGKEIRVFKGHAFMVTSVAVSPDSTFIVTGSEDKTTQVWNFATGGENRVLKGHIEEVTSAAISPDSKFIVTGSHDMTAQVWDFLTGEEKMVLKGHTSTVRSVAISPDSTFVVTGSYDNTAQVWNLVTSEEKVLRGHTDWVNSVAISPDSRFIVTGSRDNTVRMWNAQTGDERRVLEGHSSRVTSVAVSPDSRFILSTDNVDERLVWEVVTGLQSQLSPHECGFPLQTADSFLMLGGLNTVGYSQDSFADMQRVGSMVLGGRENGYECWALSTQSQCLLAVADSDPIVEPKVELAAEPPSNHLDGRPDNPQTRWPYLFFRRGRFVPVLLFAILLYYLVVMRYRFAQRFIVLALEQSKRWSQG